MTRIGATLKRQASMGRRTLRRTAAAVLAVTTLLGGSTSLASGAASASTSSITIGVDATESGPTAPQEAGSIPFFMAYIDYLNAKGGIDGHHIDVKILDDKGDDAQALLNFETLWEQDHVSLIVKISEADAPYDFIKQNSVPTFTYTGDPRIYASYYPTIITDGDNIAEVGGETAWWLTHIEHKHPKIVGVQYLAVYSTWNSFIKNYWKKDGATKVIMVPDGGPTADCSSIVTKFKAAGVQYWDMQGLESSQCILAEQRLGWKPPLGEGGALVSQLGQALLIGKPMIGIVAGSPNTLSTGAPIYSKPTPVDLTFQANIKKYAPKWDSYAYLNGTTTIIGYGLAMLSTDVLGKTLAGDHSLSASDIVKTAQGIKNYNNGLQPPVESFAPSCKTGSDGTIWGYWEANPNKAKGQPALELKPTSGPHWIDGKDVGVSPCQLTIQANKAYPHG